MRNRFATLTVAATLFALPLLTQAAGLGASAGPNYHQGTGESVQLGPRPFHLVENMSDGELKSALQQCTKGPFYKTDFSIGHRGAALQFPEHTEQSYRAGARMGAGVVECDVTFTADKELVCRHSQCDLATTTNILATPLAEKCSVPFQPAVLGADGAVITPARATCCTSDITLDEFKSLCGKMDASNPAATTAEAFMGGTAGFRTELYATCGTVMTHAESIELFKSLGVKMTPELKSPSVAMPFDGFTQAMYAQKMIDEYKAAGVSPRKVFAQSFNLPDVLYWIGNEPAFGMQAVYLDDADTTADLPDLEELKSYTAQGVRIVAPPMWALVEQDAHGEIVPSDYARDVKAAGLDIITWTLERSAPAAQGLGWYYQTTEGAYEKDGDYLMKTLDVLAKEVGILGIFSDWPATVTYYANCMGLR